MPELLGRRFWAGGYRNITPGQLTAIDSALHKHDAGIPAPYRGASLIKNSATLGSYRRAMPRALWWSYGGGLFLMSEVPL